MKFIKNTFALLLVSLVLFSSCSRKKKNVAAGYIPADASAVVAVNADQLMTKLAKDGINMQKMGGLIFGQSGDTTTKPGVFWQGADSSGVDFKEPIYISLNIPSKITDQNAVVRIIVQLKDAERFAKTIDILDGEIKKEDKFTYITTDESAIGYNNKTAIYVAHLNADAITGMKTAGVFSIDSLGDAPELPAFTGKMALELVRASFNLEKENSLAANDDFDEMPIDKNDIKIWANYTTGMDKMLKGSLADAAVILKPLLKDSYSSSVLNFENGAIKGTSKMYFQKDAAEAIKKSASRDIDLAAIGAFPGKSLNAYIGVAYDPAMIRDLLEFVKWEGAAAAGLSKLNLTVGDVINSFTGDISFLLADANTPGLTVLPGNEALGKANWAAIARLNDKAALEKILNSPMILANLKKDGNTFIIEGDSSKVYFNIKDNNLYIGGNPQLLAQFMDGTKKNDFASGPLARFSKKPLGVYFSAASLVAGDPKNFSILAVSGFRELIVTSQHFEKNYLQSDMEINTINKEQNALSSAFNSVFNYMQLQMRTIVEQEGDEEYMPPLKPMEVK